MMRRNKIHPLASSLSRSTANITPSTWEDSAPTKRKLSQEEKDIVQAAWQVLSQDLEGFGCQVLTRLEQISSEAYAAYTAEAPVSDVTSDYSCSVQSGGGFIAPSSSYTLQQPCGIGAFRCHAKRTMETYGMVVFGLDELEAIYPLLKSTGRRLARRGVQPRHLQAMSSSMLSMVESVFLGEWCADWSRAWLSLISLVESGHLAGVHGEQQQQSPPPLYLPLSPAVPDYHHGYLSSPSAASWSSTSAGSSLSSFSLSSPQSASSCSASATSSSSCDDSPPKQPDLSWACRPAAQAWPAVVVDNLALPSSPAAGRGQRWCVNIPALLRSSKKHRRRSDPSSLAPPNAKSGRQSSVPKWMLRYRPGIETTPVSETITAPKGNTFRRSAAHKSMSNLL